MTRLRAEAALAVLFAAAIMLAGGAATYFVVTMSVHTDPKAVPSTAAAVGLLHVHEPGGAGAGRHGTHGARRG